MEIEITPVKENEKQPNMHKVQRSIDEYSLEELEIIFGRLMRQRTILENQIKAINQDLTNVDTEIGKKQEENKK